MQYGKMWSNLADLVEYGLVETAIDFAVGMFADFHINDNTGVLLQSE